jgi:hypothetical protein
MWCLILHRLWPNHPFNPDGPHSNWGQTLFSEGPGMDTVVALNSRV